MAREIVVHHNLTLDDYASVAQLASRVHELRVEAGPLAKRLAGRTVWMVNSTEQGGGVAEMLPTMIALLRELGVETRWAVLETEDDHFFRLTKRIHNLIHDAGDPELGEGEREAFERVSEENAGSLGSMMTERDILVIHDPQPVAVGAILRARMGVPGIWRCHIGLARRTERTSAAWRFLEQYATVYDHAVFSAPEYIPEYLAHRSTVIHPAIDPLSHKNRTLQLHKLVGILCNAGLVGAPGPTLTPAFPDQAQRLQPDGTFLVATEPEDIGLLFRPIITQVSRWDRLKGFAPLMQGFIELKELVRDDGSRRDDRHRRAIELSRLVLAGPDPGSIQDDPEAQEVLEELVGMYRRLPPETQRDIAILALPMASPKYNALMVNALQRCSTIVAQNSLQEGFGLTATEAMWKGIPVLVSCAHGLRQQVRDPLDGRTVRDAEDAAEIASRLDEMLADSDVLEAMGTSGQHRVHHDFLIFTQLEKWVKLLVERAN